VTDKPAKKERFEDHLKVVEEAVKSLEGGKLGLEESIEKYEQGIKALRLCYSILEQAEKKIQMLVKDKDGALAAKDFDPASASAQASAGKPAADDKPSRKKVE
jgi:exodeoxyribonuclease VII small subunit